MFPQDSKVRFESAEIRLVGSIYKDGDYIEDIDTCLLLELLDARERALRGLVDRDSRAEAQEIQLKWERSVIENLVGQVIEHRSNEK